MTFSNLKHIRSSLRRSLALTTLLKMAISITLVMLLTSITIYLFVLEELERQASDSLSTHVIERADRESMLFRLAEDNHKVLKFIFVEEWNLREPENLSLRFDELFESVPDGTHRLREIFYTGTQRSDGSMSYHISGFVGKGVEFDSEFQRKAVLAYELIDRFAAGWHTRFPNLYISFPENAAIYHWPGIRWGRRAAADLEINNEEWVYVANPENNPGRDTVWTGLYFDQTADEWVVSVETPVYINDQHFLTIGNDILLRELFRRTFDSRKPGVHNFIIRKDGRLIAHPERRQELLDSKGVYNVFNESDGQLSRMLELIRERGKDQGVITDDKTGRFLAFSSLEGPDWLFVSVLPRSLLQTTALDVAKFLVLLGLFLLFIETILLYVTLQESVSRPLESFLKATRKLTRVDFDFSRNTAELLAFKREDEVGRLARSFNEMVERLAAYSTRLEETVGERTRELVAQQAETQRQKDNIEIALETMDQGVILVDKNLEIVAYNRKLLEIFSLEEEKLRDIRGFEELTRYVVVDIEDEPDLFDVAIERAKSTSPCTYDFELPNGRMIDCRHKPVEGGGFVRTYTDITERITELQEMSRTQSQLKAAMRAGKLGTWNLDIDRGVLSIDEQSAVLFGYTSETLNRDPGIWKHIIHPDDYAGVVECQRACLKGETAGYRVEYRAFTREGELIWIESRGENIDRRPEGGSLYISGTHTDVTARKKVELAFRENQKLLHGIVESSSLIIYAKDRSGHYILINRLWENVHGIKRGDALGKTDLELLPAETGGLLHFNDMKVLNTGKLAEIEESFVSSDGQQVTYLSTKFPLQEDNGEIRGVCTLSTNITERKAIERSLKESQSHLNLALEAGNMGILEIDLDNLSTRANEYYARMLGYAPEELKEEMKANGFLQRIIHPEDYPGFAGQIEALLGGSSDLVNCVFRAYTRQGELRWFDYRGVATGMSKNNRPRKLVGTQTDITSRRITEEHVKENQQLLDAVIQNNANVVYVKDPDGKFLLVNREYEKLMGVQRDDVLGRTSHDVFGQEFGDRVRKNDLKIMNSRRSVRTEEKIGSKIFLTYKFPLFDGQGKVSGVCGMATEITEQKALQEQLSFRLELEHLVTSISSMFDIESDIDESINKALAQFGRLTRSARISLWQFSEDKQHVSMANEWCAEGVKSQLEATQAINLPRSKIEELGLVKEFESGNTYYIREMDELPVEHERIRAFFTGLGIRAFAAIPILQGSELIAYFTLNEPERLGELDVSDLSILKVFGEALHSGVTRLRAERDLIEAKEKAEKASSIATVTLQNMNQGVVMADSSGRVLVCNDRLLEYWQLTRKDLEKHEVLEDLLRFGERDFDENTRQLSLANALESGNTGYVATDSRKNTYEIAQVSLPGGGIIRTYSNITYLRNAVVRAKEQEANLRTLVSCAPIPMEIITYKDSKDLLENLNFQGEVEFYINQSFTENYGWCKEDFSSLSELLVKLYPEESYREELQRKWSALQEIAREEGQQFIGRFEMDICCKNGEIKPVEASQSIIANQQVFTLVDLSEHRQARERLATSEARFKLAMESANIGVWDADLVKGVAHYNDQYFRMLGYDRHDYEADHEKWVELVHPDDRERSRRNAERLTRGDVESNETEFRMMASDGEERHIMSIGRVASRGADGNPTRVIGVHLDITHRKKLEAMLQAKKNTARTGASGKKTSVGIKGTMKRKRPRVDK